MREDVAELKNLLERAQRDKVKYILSIELRKLETKLADLVETEAKQKDGTAAASATAKNASSGQRSYDVEIKNYCNYEPLGFHVVNVKRNDSS